MRARCAAMLLGLALAACDEDLSLPPIPNPGGGSCTSDTQCSVGICDPNTNTCVSTECRTTANCASGVCVLYANLTYGTCKPTCQTSADCTTGQQCVAQDGGYGYCLAGCVKDGDCPGCDTCSSGYCVPSSGPPLLGTPSALKMRDNLSAAVAYVRAQPDAGGAMLILVSSAGLKSDGTVDITDGGYVPRWIYGFQLGDGSTAPAQFLSVTYLLQGGSRCGLYDGNAGNLSASTFIPDTTWQGYDDSPALVSGFEAQPNCAALQGTTTDSLVYNQQSTGPQFFIGNWKSQDELGNPLTGASTYLNCP